MIIEENRVSKMNTIKISEKEIDKLEFPSYEVIRSRRKRRYRNQMLKAASLKKDKAKNQLKITIQSAKRGMFTIVSHVLMVNEEHLVINGGHVIPLNAIKKVD